MARTTRSAAHNQEKDKQPDPTTSGRAKSSTKKRKRTSLTADDDQPAQKQIRSENSIKEEHGQDDDQKFDKGKLPELELAGDVPIDPSDAQKVLDILQLIDSQGLLDRVFPLPSSNLSEPSTSKSQTGTFSLRTLLRESSQHPLRVLRAAVQNLFPISYHPRSRTSSPAAQQLRFCNLAWSLLDQASFHSVPLPLDIETILSDYPETPAEPETKTTPGSPRPDRPTHSHQTRRYALMQRLPSGTWWSSLSSDLVPSGGKTLKDLPTANAELVAILPSPSGMSPSEAASGSAVSLAETPSITLGSYVPKKPPGYKPKLPGPRRVSCGAFLDYGPFASFAPVFEQDGVELGRSAMGELFWRWEERKKSWLEEQEQVAVLPQPDNTADVQMANGADAPLEKAVVDDEGSLEGLFLEEQITLLKQALGSLELEAAPYTGYSYNYATPYRTGYQYKPGQATSYYPNTYAAAAAAQTTGQAQTAQQYYQGQQYTSTGQQQYAYSSWYQYNPQTQAAAAAAAAAAAGGTSGRGTPQPNTAAAPVATPVTTAAAPTTMPTSYATFFSANAQTTGQRAVANTVLTATAGSAKPYQSNAGGAWAGAAGTTGAGTTTTTGHIPPTLPPHMRSVVGAAQSGAGSAGYNGGVYQPGYYGTYQATPSPAQ
ncbi:hypothetical protein HYDPIDRAFT_173418 [Hydnomerulius pinastri MD-312]|nr:hypothetical protein HYDPIDRAFT_173418 [Hydnomerulius pinastri MD-312]